MFVLGSDTDDIATIKNTQKFARRLNIDSVQFMMLTPLPGTPVFEDMVSSGRLIHRDWSKYDAHHAVFEPRNMSAFELHIETLKAMSKFYSWSAILQNIWQFDFFYAVIGLYGKKSVRNALSGAKQYVENLREYITEHFDEKTEALRQFVLERKGSSKDIILNTNGLEDAESRFFTTFLNSLDRHLVVKKESFKVAKNTLSIAPLVEDIKSKHQQGIQQISDFYDRHKDVLSSARVVKLESLSLYKACENIGLLLNMSAARVRKAYNKATKSAGGHAFECYNMLVMVGQ